ncbi:hypothetical protein PAEPH01_0955 [Pancytospora epiphaga]|nr:hypothetical protein PAEPH01_0955 [Pancytospora epiphaga]
MSELSEEEGIYDVEDIVDDRVVNGKKQYFIKWAGYASKYNTWEYEENILSDELKKEYEEAKHGKSLGGVGKEKPDMFEPEVTNEWASKISRVLAVFLNEDKQLEVEYLTYDGIKGISPALELHVKAPIKLLKFYESNINFSE